MTTSIKEELIHCLKRLQDIPEDKAAAVQHVITELNKPENQLDNTPDGKLIAGNLLNLLAELIPQLDTARNRKLVAEKIGRAHV